MTRLVCILMLAVITATGAWAADIKILAIGALQPGLGNIADQFKRGAPHNITIQVGTATQVSTRLTAGETADVLIATPDIVEQAVRNGRAVASTAAPIGKIGIGIAVRSAAPAPDVRTMDAFKRALTAADAIIYNQGSSGVYLEKLFEQLGIAEQIKSKATRFAGGGEVIDRVLQGKGSDIGLVPVTVIKSNESRGLRLVALPADAQNYTNYTAVVMTGAPSADAARDFIRYLSSPAGKQAFAATGVE